MNNWDWNLFFSAMTGISTLAMSIVALIALDKWKEQQKRDKLINVLESLNKYIQELQLYEIESTVFSKQSRYYTEKDFANAELLKQQGVLIDIELAEEFGNCVLKLKNWLIDHENQRKLLDEISKKMQEYRVLIVDYNSLKTQYILELTKSENVLYGTQNKILANWTLEKKEKIIKIREELLECIKDFKLANKKLLK
ncbi:hypothetical protein IJO12_03430 [bacterium]|nr:hypothetical protein [bacterium]